MDIWEFRIKLFKENQFDENGKFLREVWVANCPTIMQCSQDLSPIKALRALCDEWEATESLEQHFREEDRK